MEDGVVLYCRIRPCQYQYGDQLYDCYRSFILNISPIIYMCKYTQHVLALNGAFDPTTTFNINLLK